MQFDVDESQVDTALKAGDEVVDGGGRGLITGMEEGVGAGWQVAGEEEGRAGPLVPSIRVEVSVGVRGGISGNGLHELKAGGEMWGMHAGRAEGAVGGDEGWRPGEEGGGSVNREILEWEEVQEMERPQAQSMYESILRSMCATEGEDTPYLRLRSQIKSDGFRVFG